MTLRRSVLALWLLMAGLLADGPDGAARVSEKSADISRFTNSLVLAPTESAGAVGQIAAAALSRFHFSRARVDDEMSGRWFDRYLESLDPQRMYFLQSDHTELAAVRLELDDRVARKDVRPAYAVFNRFLERLDQQYAEVMTRLDGGVFDLDTTDRIEVNRKDAPRPASLEEARGLWWNRLRLEYLSERLGQPEIPALSTNVWAKLSDVAATNRTAQLEALVGKDHAVELVRRHGDGALAGAPQVEAYLADRLPGERDRDIRDKLRRRYNRTLRTLKQYEPDDVLQFYLDALAHAFDPHTDYFGKSELDSFSISMNLSLTGIGATLQSEDGYTVIRSLVPGAPAEKSKQLKVGDKIVAVAQGEDGEWVDVVDERLNRVVEQIRGPKGSRVRLTIQPEGADPSARSVVTIVREEVKLEDSEAKAKLVEYPSDDGRTRRVGVIDLPSFYASFPVGVGGRTSFRKSTTGDVAALIRKLQAEKVDGIILDLRRNGGGSLEEAVNLTGLFIKRGPVVQVKDYNGRILRDEDEDPAVLYDGPLMVLTSRFSASASEIVAGALQDYGRAVVVGDSKTHGKGTVQTIHELGMYVPGLDVNPGAIKVTIRKFYRASGESTQLKGVVPDIILPSVNNHAEVGEGSLSNAMPWDTINPASYERVGRVEPHLAGLRDRSARRVATDKDWDYIREEEERFRKQQAEKTLSLNYAQRLREKEDARERLEARKREWAELATDEPKTWEISLKDVDTPGLPAPTVARSGTPAPADPSAAVDPDDEAEPAVAEPARDIHLREAQQILLDYIAALGGRRGVAASLGR